MVNIGSKVKFVPDEDYFILDLTQGYQTKVSIVDSWVLDRSWYAAKNADGLVYAATRKKVVEAGPRLVRLHRMLVAAGPGDVVDHINRDTLDNRRSNLRIVTALESSRNRGVFKTNRLGVRGVRQTGPNSYAARIWVNDRLVRIGTFRTVEEARERYEMAAAGRGW